LLEVPSNLNYFVTLSSNSKCFAKAESKQEDDEGDRGKKKKFLSQLLGMPCMSEKGLLIYFYKFFFREMVLKLLILKT